MLGAGRTLTARLLSHQLVDCQAPLLLLLEVLLLLQSLLMDLLGQFSHLRWR
jgi:hypothetical protein